MNTYDPFIEQRHDEIYLAMLSEKDPEKIRALQTECGLMGHKMEGLEMGIGVCTTAFCLHCGFDEK